MSRRQGGGALGGLPAAGRDAVLAAATERGWTRDELLVRDGDDAASLMIITAGHAVARLATAAGDQVTLSVLGPGDVIGEVGLLIRSGERTADVVALEPVAALVLRRPDFDRIRRTRPEVDDFVMELMARRIDRLSYRVAEAHHVPVPQRVARRLHEVGRLYVADDRPVRIPLTQEDIAGLAGATRPTVNAVLRQLERDGVVRLGRARLELVDIPELRRRCV